MRILIADDDRDLADALAEIVRECGHEVVDKVTGGGLAVIQSFARHLPEVVILDVMMPRFNGLTVSHALKSRMPETKIVFVSGKMEGDHPMLINCNASAYLQKPIGFDELRSVLSELAAPAVPAPAAKKVEAAPKAEAAKPETPETPETPEVNSAAPSGAPRKATVKV